ncbi:MAG: 4Fe-4S dicluster domain-containing protein [Ruminococcaceae bacterium]|nr:4Fe-4S dicluster domain-containing protein [Oscillospiraceae bacterium]
MIKISDKTKCSGCYACYSVCPVNSIAMKSDDEGFKYPVVDAATCINCGLCEKACPIIKGEENEDTSRVPTAYAAFNNDENIRLKSSSGGIFTLLAEKVIDKGGVVFGAAFNENFEVVHTAVEKKSDLAMLRGSKYVQSRIGESYKLAKNFLDEGRTVLFTGTPCQIGGLKAYLDRDYENLICQDIICHGVPSPAVWEKYLKYRKECDLDTVEEISFRDKQTGWKKFSLSFKYPQKRYSRALDDDLYMISFLKNRCLRPSCYDCSFKTVSRDADVTLADFWGVRNIIPEMDDDKGTSLVLVHSQKGASLFDEIKDLMTVKEADTDKAIRCNSAAIRSVPLYPKRRDFIKKIQSKRFDKVAKKHLKDPFASRCKRLVKRVVSKAFK